MVQTEIWKAVPGWEGLYEVSSQGRVRSLPRIKRRREGLNNNAYHLEPGRILSLINSQGYREVVLSKDGKTIHQMVHRLVSMAFIPNPNNYPIINHKNEVRSDNRVENLEWCSYYYNNHYGSLIDKNRRHKVICISKNGEQRKYNGINEAAKDLNLSAGNISMCCVGKRKTTGGYQWRYL